MKKITEEMNIHKEWYEEANGINLEDLPNFIKRLTEEYHHDYGTICHAITASSIATANAINKSKYGGITGFQAGAIMWEFIRHWNFENNKTGLKILDYDNFLYPQYGDKFSKTIASETWAALQKEAKLKIEEADKEYAEYLKKLDQYKIDIKGFIQRYPDYEERKEHYDPIGMGTGAQWEAEEKKKASDFEFAPQEPYEPINVKSHVFKHWLSIVDGVVPFGYTVS